MERLYVRELHDPDLAEPVPLEEVIERDDTAAMLDFRICRCVVTGRFPGDDLTAPNVRSMLFCCAGGSQPHLV